MRRKRIQAQRFFLSPVSASQTPVRRHTPQKAPYFDPVLHQPLGIRHIPSYSGLTFTWDRLTAVSQDEASGDCHLNWQNWRAANVDYSIGNSSATLRNSSFTALKCFSEHHKEGIDNSTPYVQVCTMGVCSAGFTSSGSFRFSSFRFSSEQNALLQISSCSQINRPR